METAFGSVVDPKLDPELNLKTGLGLEPELKLRPEFELDVELAPKLAEVTVTLPAPGVPWNAGRLLWPKMSRTGRCTNCAKSGAVSRMQNSMSRVRFNVTSVQS